MLNGPKIAAAALRIATEEGYEKLTMAAVARALDVAPSALYNHVAGKEDLLFLVEDAVMAQVDTEALHACAAGKIGARRAVEKWAHSYREVCALHTPLIPYLATMPISGAPKTVEMYELAVQVMVVGGVGEANALNAVVMLESFIYGSAYDVAAPASIFDVPNATEAPGLRRAIAARADSGGLSNPYADAPFEQGLASLLNGLVL
ncbi:Tetracycline repressor protein class A [Corynebacterium capitovis DSM 44611]|nr:Tetracycline repressor protein class A [Corynebacterium capitovis DSM 44611]